MNFLAWVLLGAGVFVLYSAYKGKNPLATLADSLGIQHASSSTLGGTS